jgi:hypothetical protein
LKSNEVLNDEHPRHSSTAPADGLQRGTVLCRFVNARSALPWVRERPNILLIVADDLGIMDDSLYGG